MDSEAKVMMGTEERKNANALLWSYVKGTMKESTEELKGLHVKLAITYWVIIGLSIVMFATGIALVSVPIIAAFRDISALQSLGAAGFGIADLAGLFFFRPLERIHSLMGDMSQITLALNSFQSQVGLRLMEMNVTKRQTIGQAAKHIGEAAEGSIKLVQDYFEEKRTAK
jgi:hypothetical protein